MPLCGNFKTMWTLEAVLGANQRAGVELLNPELELLASAVRNLQESVHHRRGKDVIRADFDSVGLAWKRVQDAVRGLDPSDASRDLAIQIDASLTRMARGIPDRKRCTRCP